MMSTLLPVWEVTVFLFLSLCSGVSQGVTHYCQQDVTKTITAETEGAIITRKQGESHYGNAYRCSWLIDAGVQKRTKLTILSTDLEWAPTYTTCSGYDNLQIFEGQSSDGHIITSLCGKRNPYHLISQGRYLFLTFSTTHQNFDPRTGVELQFEVFDNSTCPPGWIFSDETWCFQVDHSGTATWLDAQDRCSYSQSNLASFTSENEYQLVYGHGVNKSASTAWLGLTDRGKEGTFQWLDKQQLTYKRPYSSSKPNFDAYDCVAQDFTTGKWLVEKCDTSLNYICKARKDGSTKIYQAVPSSDSPEPGGQEKKFNYVIIIIIVLAVVLIGVLIVACVCVKRRKTKRKQVRKQELSTTRYRGGGCEESVELNSPDRSPCPRTAPTAPPAVTIDTQLVAPPTYEESLYHPIAPADY